MRTNTRGIPVPGTEAYTRYAETHSGKVEPYNPHADKPKSLGHGMSFKTWFWDKGIKQAAVGFVKSFNPSTKEGQIAILSFAAGGAEAGVLDEGWTAETVAPALSENYATSQLAKEATKPTPHVDLIRAVAGKNDIPVSRALVRSGRDIRERTVGGQAGTQLVFYPKTPGKKRLRTKARTIQNVKRGI